MSWMGCAAWLRKLRRTGSSLKMLPCPSVPPGPRTYPGRFWNASILRTARCDAIKQPVNRAFATVVPGFTSGVSSCGTATCPLAAMIPTGSTRWEIFSKPDRSLKFGTRPHSKIAPASQSGHSAGRTVLLSVPRERIRFDHNDVTPAG